LQLLHAWASSAAQPLAIKPRRRASA